MLTFDDGNYNNYTKAYPVLKKQNAKGIIFAVGTFTEKAEQEKQQSSYYSTLRKNQLNELAKSGVMEIGCHTYGFHQMTSARQGVKKKSGETLSAYRAALSKDFQKFCETMENTANTAYFAYPFGVYSTETPALLKENGVRLAFTCNEGTNRLTRSSNRYLLKRYNRPSGISSEAFFTQRKIL